MNDFPKQTAIEYHSGRIRFIDQTRLPQCVKIVETNDYTVIASAIRRLALRGAPLIGVAAAFAVAAEAHRLPYIDNLRQHLANVIQSLRATRPTAVNLFWALNRMQETLNHASETEVVQAMEYAALSIYNADKRSCEAIAQSGLPLIPYNARVLTICNTGFLATAGIGTALGIILRGFEAGRIEHVFALETRPLLQGARLTTWELMQNGIPFTLLVDGAAGSLLRRGGIDLAIIGADRIASNGDTANKIGSLQLALACIRFGVPFYVAAPFSTIDPATPSGSAIEVEERKTVEVTFINNKPIAEHVLNAYNPAFDIVDSDLITGFITDRGVIKPPYNF